MTLRTMLGFSDEHLVEGTTDAQRRAFEEEVRRARIVAARRQERWTELEEVDLVRRGRVLVSATTDEMFQSYRGAAFAPGSASIMADHATLYFYVRDHELVFLERLPRTWTEELERQAARERRRAAPKQRPAWMNQ